MSQSLSCICCNSQPLQEILTRATKQFGVSLCSSCQLQYRDALHISAHNANRLFFALKARNIDAVLSHYDGKKTVDIFVERSGLCIEVDGEQHNTNAEQALKDLMRTFYSFRKGYITLRIPNSLVKKNLRETVKFVIFIIDFLNQNRVVVISKRA